MIEGSRRGSCSSATGGTYQPSCPRFDVFALSSLYEGVPCAVVEAMRCGIPVVATAVNGVHEVVVPGRSGLLVPPRDPSALARAVNALLDDPREAARLADTAQRLLEGHFGARELGADLMETYDVALRTPGRSAPLRALRPVPPATRHDLVGAPMRHWA